MALADHALADPDRPAVIDANTGVSITWAELVGRARATARSWGLPPRSRVGLMLPNGIDLVIAQLATALAQAELVPFNWHLKAEEVDYIVGDSGLALLVVDDELSDHVPAGVAMSIGVSEELGDPLPDEWATPSWVFYTSGTTGRPKGVVHGALDPSFLSGTQDMLVQMWGFGPDEVHLQAGPGYHAGPAGYTTTTLWVGGTVVVMSQWDAKVAWRALAEHQVTSTFLTPAHMIRLLEVAEHPVPQHLRLVIQSGAPCPVPVKRRFLDELPGVEVSEMYGASEGGVTKVTREQWLSKPGSVGLPWPGVSVEIRSPDGEVLPVGEEGVVWVQPAMGRRFRYHQDDAKTEQSWQRDFFTVGDVGRLDEEGWLWLTDRTSDLVIWSGVNIYPREIESALFTCDKVVDCAVLGVPHDRDGEQLLAVVEAPGATVDELKAHLAEHLADFKVPQHWDLVETLPRDPNGKVVKRRLREKWLQR